jgi:large subunit ribosomal protein L7/L12
MFSSVRTSLRALASRGASSATRPSTTLSATPLRSMHTTRQLLADLDNDAVDPAGAAERAAEHGTKPFDVERTMGTNRFVYTPENIAEIKERYGWHNVRGPDENSPRVDRILALFDELDSCEVMELYDGLQKQLGVSDYETEMMMESSQLIKQRRKMGVSALGGGGGGGGAAAAAEAAPVVEQTEFTVKLTGFPAASKIKLIKEVRSLTGLGLKEAKALVEGTPATIKEKLSKEEAEALSKTLSDLGGEVALE